MDAFTLEPIYGSYGMALPISLILIAVTLRSNPWFERLQRKWLVRLRFLACMVLGASNIPATELLSRSHPHFGIADQSLSMTLSDGEGRTRACTERSMETDLNRT